MDEEEEEEDRATRLSGGENRRAALAIAFLARSSGASRLALGIR